MDCIFETQRLLVRLAVPADAAHFQAIWNNPRVMTYVGFPQGLGISLEQVAADIANRSNSPFDQLLVIELSDNSQPVGECKMDLPDAEGVAKTDVKLLPEFWGHKYGVEVKRGLLDYLFKHTDCVAVEATPNVANIASIKMQEAVGGVRVGEATYEFPEAQRAYTCPVHSYIYRVYRESHRRDEAGPAGA